MKKMAFDARLNTEMLGKSVVSETGLQNSLAHTYAIHTATTQPLSSA